MAEPTDASSREAAGDVPGHVAIIMDGNGRWAQRRSRPRAFGHRAGQQALESTLRAARELGIGTLTVFAFSSENWERPQDEVESLMSLFVSALEKKVPELIENGVCLGFGGDLERFPAKLRKGMDAAEQATALDSAALRLNVAVGYGGRWDIVQAARSAASKGELTDETLAANLAFADSGEPDLLIRTGGEYRISNFLLWQLAYTELYFTDCLWPDFDKAALAAAVDWYAGRERRFGRIKEAGGES
ncbi:MAG: polyprenyl diphosphate synthase [Gammaproteobacteria bacterium]|nr:polyprenyl diphosphate synthase [Gammaproteobacteria bacterium]